MNTSIVTDMSRPSPALKPKSLRSRQRPSRAILIGASAVALFAVFPILNVTVPILLPGPLSSPASLLIIAVGLVYAGLAVSYDVVFGYTGLLSAGHAMVFAVSMYGTNIIMGQGFNYWIAAGLAVLLSTVVAAGLGALALRVKALAFTMVTLAFAEALFILLLTDPFDISGGDEGLPLVFKQVPGLLANARDARWLYWLALLFAVFAYVLALIAKRSRAGRVWQAIRENESRVESLGMVPYVYKLMAFVFSGFLAAIGGSIFLVVVRGANPSSASVQFSLALIVMVVIGGKGRLWGAAIGGLLYAIITYRLPELSTSGILGGLPTGLANVLAEPFFILGLLFVLIVLFAPKGLVGVVDAIAARQRRGSEARTRQPDDIRRKPTHTTEDEKA
jgi:branched-chain amino acid transport system permease protein